MKEFPPSPGSGVPLKWARPYFRYWSYTFSSELSTLGVNLTLSIPTSGI